jgi:signal transduction histidine kinase
MKAGYFGSTRAGETRPGAPWIALTLMLLGLRALAGGPEPSTEIGLDNHVRDNRKFFHNASGQNLTEHRPGSPDIYEGRIHLGREIGRPVVIRTRKGLSLSAPGLDSMYDSRWVRKENWDFHLLPIPSGDTVTLRIGVGSGDSVARMDLVIYDHLTSATMSLYLMPFDTLRPNFLVFGFAFLLLFLALGVFTGYLTTRRKDYIYYALYIVSVLAFFLFRKFGFLFDALRSAPGGPAFDYSLSLFDFARVMQPVSYMLYGLFARHFLDTPRTYPLLDTWLIRFIGISGIAALSLVILDHFNLYWTEAWYLYRILAIVMAVSMTVMILRSDIPLSRYIGWGSAFLVIGGMVAMVNSFTSREFMGLGPLDFLKLGFLLEMMCFSMGMARKTSMISEEKLAIQLEYNRTLETLHRSESQRKRQLEEELERKSQAIREEVLAKTKAEMDLKMVEQEMKTLMNQLNPHFVFNSLTALKWHVYNNQPDKASELIDRLAKLIRTIHMFSRESAISLRQEIGSLELYVSLENERLSRKIDLQVEVEAGIDMEQEPILPLLVQPLVENAIWHGLVHGDIAKPEIRIRFGLSEGHLLVSVGDNGIGMEASKARKHTSRHLGIATDIIRRKLEIHNGKDDGLEVIELKHPDGSSAGTEVRIRMKRLSWERSRA